MKETVLVFVPHPDDAEFSAGGTLAGLAKQGRRIVIVVATDGSAGTLEQGGSALARRRRGEGEAAAKILGAQPPILLGYRDFTLDRMPVGELRERFIRLIRTYRPSILFAQDPTAERDPHPDHRAVAEAASDAVNFSNLPAVHPEHASAGLAPHFVAERYFFSEDPARINRVVDISATIDTKIAALLAHESQVEFLFREFVTQAGAAGVSVDAFMSLFAGSAGETVAPEPGSGAAASIDVPGSSGAQSGGGSPADLARRAIAWAVRETARTIGTSRGIAFGEGFRYVRFHPYIEALPGRQEENPWKS